MPPCQPYQSGRGFRGRRGAAYRQHDTEGEGRGGEQEWGRERRPHDAHRRDVSAGGRGGEGGRGGRGKHPAHLKGRDIGLWYAGKSSFKKKERDREEMSVVQIDAKKETALCQLLKEIEESQEACVAFKMDARAKPVATYQGVKDGSLAGLEDDAGQFESGYGLTSRGSAMSLSRDNSASNMSALNLAGGTSEEADDVDEDFSLPEMDEDMGDLAAELKEINRSNKIGGTSLPTKLMTQLCRNETLDGKLLVEAERKQADSHWLKMQGFRRNLPSYAMQQKIVETIKQNQVVVLSGETGCGKTTQVPQFILDDYIKRGDGSLCRVACTQPRRISAITVAERVADERAEPCGGCSTGYQIRLQSRLPREQGSIMYCTTGIMLRWLTSDRVLSRVSHIVLDEVHERDLQSDFLIIIVRDILPLRPDLKLILMSATLNADQFSTYFGTCPMLHIPGYTFPVTEYLLEDVVEMTRYFPEGKALQQEKRDSRRKQRLLCQEDVMRQEEYSSQFPVYLRTLQGRYSVHTVDAIRVMNTEIVDHQLILAVMRHIVTGIREEGAILTFLPGWSDISNVNKLLSSDTMFRSKSFLVIPLHSMMPTVSQKEVFNRPPPGVRKIILATNIAETSITIDDVVFVIDCGKTKMKKFDVENNITTLKAEWVALANAKQRSGRAGRVQAGYCFHLYNRLQQSLMDAYQLPEILRTPLEELCLQVKLLRLGLVQPFVSRAMEPPSDAVLTLALRNLTTLNALDENEDLTALGFHLARMPTDPHTGKMILFAAMFRCLDPVLTIAASLSFKDAFVIPLYHLAGNTQLVKAVICAGLYPKVAKLDKLTSKSRFVLPRLSTKTDGTVKIHPKSVNAEEKEFDSRWIVYHLKMKTAAVYLFDTTNIAPCPLLFFGGRLSIRSEERGEMIVIDDYIELHVPTCTAYVIKGLRRELDNILEYRITHPGITDWTSTTTEGAVLRAIVDLLTTEVATIVKDIQGKTLPVIG
ncbi:PREDICTED: ATP-dependent RNA helicase DHX36-like [Priapulus caudatus]|uniref:RNA helicase n=1 Tax=Priapulus caudatus TaxID=37621 RepID=A0ABM1EE09_PRICU|nr:PREDICTED: ATP-dependent RNA helicase DHX36-like [Priapulus caudatus]